MGRQENIEIFEDSQRMYGSNPRLISAIKKSNEKQEFFAGDCQITADVERVYEKPARIIVSKKRTLEAAAAYAEKQVCILNFASATNPGGGVTKGSSAQEEAICRCSTLYPNLKEPWVWNKFYGSNRRQQNPLHKDDCIYTPEVLVFKSDTSYPKLLPEKNWYSVNVLTCAAPNLRKNPSNGMNSGDGNTAVNISRKDLQALHEKRMRRVLEIAAAKGNEVVILGAFGCGAFCNPSLTVAQAMRAAVQEYRMKFETIEFAVYCSTQDDENYRVFRSVLGRL